MISNETTNGSKRGHDDSNNEHKNTKKATIVQNSSSSSSSSSPPTATQYIIPSSQYTSLPPELQSINFTNRISWRKFKPYPNTTHNLPLTPIHTQPTFIQNTTKAALDFHIHAISKRARATTIHLPKGRKVPTPIFMPVGTKGSIKSLTTEEIMEDELGGLNCPIILGNTYHLALQPGTELIRDVGSMISAHSNGNDVSASGGGLHEFMNWKGGILTDSGGFQMVSLLKLAEITEEGVTFENPFENNVKSDDNKDYSNEHDDVDTMNDNKNDNDDYLSSKRMLLRPEDSIYHQNNIGSDIMMALDDVVSSVTDDNERFTIATYRTLRWLDRCIAAHSKPNEQNLFAIVQGGLDVSLGGLREKCLAGFMKRDDSIPGYAIGGLAGGESKDDFWKVVDQCCKALPDDKPRYLMGVGYPLDLVVCSALGVDMYDCVYPTRTARFGVALVRGGSGTMRLKSNEFYNDHRVIMEGCKCQACAGGFSRSKLHILLKRGNPLATALMTNHNIAYMMYLVRGMRDAIMEDRYEKFVNDFMKDHFTGKENGGEDIPQWVRDALDAADIKLDIQ